MILSFHPNIVGDQNILCAGRQPNADDETAIRKARAVILPQGPCEALYRMCRKHCLHVFPNYDVRFDYPGKVGQARLFTEMGVPMPETRVFDSVSEFDDRHGRNSPVGYPCVFKFDLGGEGEGVFLIKTREDLRSCLERAALLQDAGCSRFLLQAFVPHGGRSLRVVVIGDQVYSYWRCQVSKGEFRTNLTAGAMIDPESEPQLQVAGREAVGAFCARTGINLAGFDLLFPERGVFEGPLFLEINYFFGRKGLGGSMMYYQRLEKAVDQWLSGIGLGR